MCIDVIGVSLALHYCHYNLILFVFFFYSYFPASSTAEMLEEWRPYLCPFDMSMVEKVGLLCAFLPTQVMPDEHNISFKYCNPLLLIT